MIPQGDSSNMDRHTKGARAMGRNTMDAVALLDNLDSPILVIGPDTTVHFANKAVERVMGIVPAECTGRRIGEAIPALAFLGVEGLGPAIRATTSARPLRVALGGACGPSTRHDVIARRHGEGACIELRNVGEREDRGSHAPEPDPPNGACRDFVLGARLIEPVQNVSPPRSAFLATVSHELRTPLTALTGYGELLADQILGPLNEQQRDMVERMCSVTHRLAVMIEEILTYSSLEADREVVKAAPAAPGAIVRAAASAITAHADQKGITIEIDVPPDVGAIHTDADKVRQVLVHLGSNAVKFTEHGSIRLGVERRGSSVRFSVRDTGIGMDSSSIDRLFQPFVQLDAGLTRKHGGTGLGLYISRRFSALLGGRIDVLSKRGSGSEFTLVLPDRFEGPRADA